uniref:Putative phloem protein 2-like protein n=1 Tax=Helianthus annuus TaxID=4232 RepID=A0A251VAQ2_HELAN
MPPSMQILYPHEIPVSSHDVCRFQYKVDYLLFLGLRLKVKTQFLSPNVTYTINLVYKCKHPLQHNLRIPFKYKLEEMSEYSKSCVAHVGEHGWLKTELFQFTSTKKKHNFDIHFLSEMKGWKSVHLSIEGVEFRPVDFEQDENKVDVQPADELDWEERLPDDYTKIVKNIDESTTQKEIYFLLRKGVYINNSQQWFSISKKSKQRLMLPARTILTEEKSGCYFLSRRKSWLWKALPGSRLYIFNEAAEACERNHIVIRAQIESQLLSHDTMYACYLVFKLPENASVFEGIVITGFKGHFSLGEATKHYTYLVAPPHTPIIKLRPGERAARTRKIKGHPKLRKDGWMEIPVWEFQLDSNFGYSFYIDGYLKSFDKWNFTGLLIQGIEFRPAKAFM